MKKILNTGFSILLIILFINCSNNLYSEDFWEQMPGPDGGAGLLKLSPDGTLYALAKNIWRSTNDGDTWECLNNKNFTNFPNGIEVDNNGNIYTTTKDQTYKTLFLHISSDKGDTWIEKEFGTESESINSIGMSNDTTMFVLMQSYLKKITIRNDESLFVEKIIPNPSTYNRYLNFYISRNNHIYVTTKENIYYSSDNGINWEKFNFEFECVNNFEVTVTESGAIFAISDIGYVWRSLDNGINFTKINKYGFTVDINAITFDKNNDLLAFSTEGICKSSDLGENWEYITEVFIFDPIQSTIVKDKNGNLLIGDYEKILKSIDGGYNWTLNNKGLNSIVPNRIDAFNKTNSILTYYLYSNKSLFLEKKYFYEFYSIDCNSKDFITVTPNEFTQSMLTMKIDLNDNIYIANTPSYSTLFRSTDYGKEWHILEGIKTTMIRDFYFGEFGLALILSSDSGYIYKSTDFGENWNLIWNDFYYDKIEYINNELIFIWGYHNGVSKSTDQGNTWHSVNFDSNFPVSSLVADYNNNIYANSGTNLFISTNSGDNWSLYDNAIKAPYPLLFISNSNILYAISQQYGQGVYRSSDLGQTWEQINSGIEDVSIQDFTLGPDGRIYLATTRFVFRSKEPVNSVDENIDAVKNEVNVFPNPLSNSGEVKFELEQTGIIEVKIYDILGNPLQTIYKGMKEAGLNKIQFSTEQFSSGVYYILINSGSNKYVEKFVKF